MAKRHLTRAPEAFALLAEALPIVQTVRRSLRRHVFATGVYHDAMVFARLRDEVAVPPAARLAGGLQALLDCRDLLGGAQVFPFSDIVEMTVTPLRRRGTFRKMRIDIVTRRGRSRLVTWWPAFDPIYAALEQLLGSRLRIEPARADAKHICRWLGLTWLALLPSCSIVAIQGAGFDWQDPFFWTYTPLIFMASAWYAIRAFAGSGSGHVGAVPPPRWRARRIAKAREPMRAPRWGWALRILGVVLLAGAALGTALLSVQAQGDRDVRAAMQGLMPLLLTVPLLPGVICLVLGYRLTLPTAASALASDGRAPLLYLRSFLDDSQPVLERPRLWRYLLGVGVPPLAANARSAFFRLVMQLSPVRLFWLAVGRGVDTAEEHLARALRRIGPLVAVGRPGERLSTAGAVRLYVDDDSWQAVVLELIGKSRTVILQPGATSGVWWEIEQTFARVPPQRVLLMLDAVDNVGAYRFFKARFEAMTRLRLPEFAGDAALMAFDGHGQGVGLPRLRASAFRWPWLQSTIDLPRTLAPFIHGLESLDARPSDAPPVGVQVPAKRRRGRFIQGIEAFAAVVVWNVLLTAFWLLPYGALWVMDEMNWAHIWPTTYTPSSYASSGTREADDAPVPPSRPAATDPLTYKGRLVAWSIALDSRWQEQSPVPEHCDRLFADRDGAALAVWWVPQELGEGGAIDPEVGASNVVQVMEAEAGWTAVAKDFAGVVTVAQRECAAFRITGSRQGTPVIRAVWNFPYTDGVLSVQVTSSRLLWEVRLQAEVDEALKTLQLP